VFGLGLAVVFGLMGTWVPTVRLYYLGMCPWPWARLALVLAIGFVFPSVPFPLGPWPFGPPAVHGPWVVSVFTGDVFGGFLKTPLAEA